MSDPLRRFTAEHHAAVTDALHRLLPRSNHPRAAKVNEAVSHAVFPGGRRFRPTLTLLAARVVGGQATDALLAACAMEFLHCSSLVFDDLPAMDDANERRGRPSLHASFGEGVSVLAGLALLNGAYELLSRCSSTPIHCVRVMREAADCIGMNGMIGGQAIDLAPRTHDGGFDVDLSNRNLKTTALVRLTMVSGAIACGASESDLAALRRCGDAIGTAYQIVDDLLDDDDSDAFGTGKPAGQDLRHGRPTALARMCRADAGHAAARSIDESRAAIIDRFGRGAETMMLCDAVTSIVDGRIIQRVSATDSKSEMGDGGQQAFLT